MLSFGPLPEQLGGEPGRVDADAEEGDMPEIEDAGIAEAEIPARRDDRVDEGDDEEVADIRWCAPNNFNESVRAQALMQGGECHGRDWR